jgi:hypothetical protein
MEARRWIIFAVGGFWEKIRNELLSPSQMAVGKKLPNSFVAPAVEQEVSARNLYRPANARCPALPVNICPLESEVFAWTHSRRQGQSQNREPLRFRGCVKKPAAPSTLRASVSLRFTRGKSTPTQDPLRASSSVLPGGMRISERRWCTQLSGPTSHARTSGHRDFADQLG